MTIDVNSYHECASTIVDAASHNQNDIIIDRAISTIDAVDNNTDDAIIIVYGTDLGTITINDAV